MSIESESSIDEVECAFCHGRGVDPYGLLSELSQCGVCHGRKRLRVKGPRRLCVYCAGSGSHKTYACPVCRGSGWLTIRDQETEVCDECRGTAVDPGSKMPCLKCRGRGLRPIWEVTGMETSTIPGVGA